MTEAAQLIEKFPSEQKKIALMARDRLFAVAPDLTETVKWGNPTYALNEKNLFALISHKAHVNLQIWIGAKLPDPNGIVEGTGKSMRHVKLHGPSDISQDLDEVIVAAVQQHLES